MINETAFHRLVAQSLDRLPAEFARRLDNVTVLVAPWPSETELKSVGLTSPQELLGLYQGVPPTRRNSAPILPDKITIFMHPILLQAKTPQAIQTLVARVVKHEIAHHFGLNEAAVRRRGL